MQCVATHAYTGEDEDELCFEKGDTILVIPFENQEDEVGRRCMEWNKHTVHVLLLLLLLLYLVLNR